MGIEIKKCGIIMPISGIGGYSAGHWQEVKSIIIEATQQVEGHQFQTEIVSNSDGEIDVIHKRIIQNIYNADIVVCDISGRNPNVLFELGMRLTFDKPTILIKDDQTDFIFDTGVIEHITYPKDLRFSKIVQFKDELATRIKQTYEKSVSDPHFSTFLRNFGTFKVPKLEQTTITDVNQLLLDEMNTIRRELMSVKKEIAVTSSPNANVRTYLPSGLKEIIYNYINDSNDMDSPDTIVIKEEFFTYLDKNGIELNKISKTPLINYIKSAQDEALPF